jgi:hypothetical protein
MLQRHWLTVALGVATTLQVVAAVPGSPEAQAEKQAALETRAANLAAAATAQAGDPARDAAIQKRLARTAPVPITDLSITPLDFSAGNALVGFDWTPPTTDIHGLPLTIDSYIFLTVETDPYAFSNPYVEPFPSNNNPPLVANYAFFPWLESAYARIIAVDEDGFVVAATHEVPWRHVDEIPGYDRDAPNQLLVGPR